MKKILLCNKNFDKKKMKELIESYVNNYGIIRTCYLIQQIKKLGFRYATKAGISLGTEDLIIPSEKKLYIRKTEKILEHYKLNLSKGKINKQEYEKKIIDTWGIANETLKLGIIKNFREKNIFNPVYMMVSSGARGNISQIKQLIGIRGLMSDSKGNVIIPPIKKNLKEGLNQEEFFISCYGARKGIIDTALKTANSGYLTRKLIYVCQNIYIKQSDCKLKTGKIIRLNISNKKKYLESKSKILGRVINENLYSRKQRKILMSKGQDICNYTSKKILKYIKNILIRSPLVCLTNTGLCQLCYGWNLAKSKLVNLGESVGIIAAQSIGEPGTQLTMRTFHTGGIFKNEVIKVIQAPNNGIINFNEKKLKKIYNKYGTIYYILKDKQNFYIKKKSQNISKINIPKLSIVFVRPLQKIFKKQIIAEIPKWKKINKKYKDESLEKSKNIGIIYIKPCKNPLAKDIIIINGILINIDKLIPTEKMKEKNSIKKNIDKKFKKVLKLNYINNNKLSNLLQTNKKKKKNYIFIIKRKKKKDIFCIKENNIINCKEKKQSKRIGHFSKRNRKTGQKINSYKIEKYRKKLSVKKIRIYCINKNSLSNLKSNTIIKKNQTITITNYKKEKSKDIVEGLPRIESILECRKSTKTNINQTLKSINKKIKNNTKITQKLQNLILKRIQNVYKSQNVQIAEKHFEIVINEMTSKVIITKSTYPTFIAGEVIENKKIQKLNKAIKNKIKYEPIILGISALSLTKNSFVSSACFQETTRILTKAAIAGKIDWLKGLKENIIMGNLIPIGTGYIKK